MKNQLYLATIVVLAGIAACDITTGDCHLRGSGDSEGVGSGIINSTGPGNPGDDPSGSLPTSACNAPDESSSGNGGGRPMMPKYCATDPPWGCVGLCLQANPDEPTWLSFTGNCKDISAGPQTVMFVTSAGQGGFMCDTDPGADNPVVYPTTVGIEIKQVESGDGCTPPPPPPWF